jgi:hypothetical protein
MKLIESKTLVSANSTIEFTSIPQTFTDLILLGSSRADGDGIINVSARFNTDSGSNYSLRLLYAENSTSALSTAETGTKIRFFYSNSNNTTSNTFSNWCMTIPNYTSSLDKSLSIDHTTEHNGTSPMIQGLTVGRWSGTAAITRITLTHETGANFVAGSIVSLYGVLKGTDGIVTTSP